MIHRIVTVSVLMAIAAPSMAQRLPDPQVKDLFAQGADAALVVAYPFAAVPRTVTLGWPGPVALTVTVIDGDVVARYPHLPAAPAIEAFAAAIGDRVARFDWGPDNLVIRAAPGQRLIATAIPAGLVVNFTPNGGTAPAMPVAAKEDVTDLLLAQAEVATGYPGRARRRIAAIVATRPNDPALQAALASAEYAAGRTAAAAHRYRALPDHGGVAGRIAGRATGPAVESAFLIRDGNGFGQTDYAVRGGMPVSGAVRIEGGVRHVRTHGDDPAGTPSRLKNDATEAGLTLGVDSAPGLRLQFDLTGLVDRARVGAAAALNIGDPERRAGIRLAYHLPDFATPSGALFGGWADRVTAGSVLRVAPGATVRLDATLARYGLFGGDPRLTTVALDGGIDYLLRRQFPSLSIGYRIDAEYILDREDGRGTGPYATFDDRENHTIEATLGQPVARFLSLTGAAGWTVNRFGGDGPTASIGVAMLTDSGWEGSVATGISSVSRPGQPARQTFGRAAVTRRLGTLR